jgi:pyrimidine deaminase RibD-like protein
MRMTRLPTLYPCAHASRKPPSVVILSLFGGEVRVVAVPGNRFVMASKSMLLSGAMVVVKSQIRSRLDLEPCKATSLCIEW